MTPDPTTLDILTLNQAALSSLERAIALQSHRFALILARCNYHPLQAILLEVLTQRQPNLQVLSLPPHIPSLLAAIQLHLRLSPPGSPPPAALMVTDLEAVDDLETVLKTANLARDSFPSRLPCPLVLWVNDEVLSQMAQLAQDFKNLGPPTIRFEMPPQELVNGLQREANELFSRFLKGTPDPIPARPLIDLSSNHRLNNELTYALQDLARANYPLSDELRANLNFVQGRQAHSRLEMETARTCYQASLAYWEAQTGAPAASGSPAPSPQMKRAVLLFHLGLWWRSFAVLQRSTYTASLASARESFEASLMAFELEERPDLVARCLLSLAEVLQKLGDWDTLEAVARPALVFHEQTGDWVRQARDRGFLAEVALHRQDWVTAQAEALRALELLVQAEQQLQADPHNLAIAAALQIARQFQRGWYRFLLGEAQMHLDQPQNAIALLEQAHQEVDPEADLTLYLQILEELIHHHYELGDYQAAFEVKLELRRAQYRHNIRAFIGAGALQPHKTLLTAQAGRASASPLSPAIEASGRQQDVENLLQRLQEARYQVIVIHGPSGVGKSSILNAGLIPALRRITPEGRTTLPILVQTYSNWEQGIAEDLHRALPQVALPPFPDPSAEEAPSTTLPTPLLGQLQAAIACHTFVIFIFDQFEDFFFEATELAARQRLYQFLEACLKLPWAKVVLVLREDYLHHLLEIERLVDVSMIDGGLLCNPVRYALGNFSRQNAEIVIHKLTESAQYYLEEALIHRLVEDLAEETGEVRPIELQVVGAQLQRDNITTLKRYEALGDHPKEKLVQQFLRATVKDCGPPNELLAQILLFQLTDEDEEGHPCRPLKTREDLEYELGFLGIEFESEQLDLVLYVLVESGLLFQFPEEPGDFYQLVHDYLVKYVRQEQPLERPKPSSAPQEAPAPIDTHQHLALQQRIDRLEQLCLYQKRAIALAIGGLTLSLGFTLMLVFFCCLT